MNRTQLTPSFSRPLWAEIDLGALRHNVRCLRSRNDGRILPVIKANGYGHGAIACAKALQDDLQQSEMFCVASVDEGVTLRAAGIQASILVLSALLPEEANACVEHHLTATISSLELANALDNASHQQQKEYAEAHFKIDSGMARLGAAPCRAVELWKQISTLPHLRITGIYTHFACADEDEDKMTCQQRETFQKALEDCGVNWHDKKQTRPLLHAANSAAAWRYPSAAFDAVRPGIAIYGVSPFASKVLSAALHTELQPVMQLKAKVTLTKQLASGASVSYGATWRASRQTRLAVLPVGYADGYHRSLSNCGKVLLRDQLCPIVGRITMDQSIVDVTAISPPVQVGEEVALWNNALPVETVATWADTIGYEMLTGVASRVPRVYK